MPTVVDVHSHAVPGRFVEQVRREGARYGFTLEEPQPRMPGRAPRARGPTAGDAYDRAETIARGASAVPIGAGTEVTTPDGVSVGVGPQKSDESVRQREMAEVGIDLRLQSVSPGMMSYGAGETQAEWFARALNESQGEDMRAFPDRVSAMATVPLQFPLMAVRELERCAADHGMRSVQIATNVNGENLDQPRFSPFWEAAQGLGVLVFIHPQYLVARHRLSHYHLDNLIGNPLDTTIAAASLIFGGVLERYPRLKIVLAHAGGYAPWIRGRWRHGYEARGGEARSRGATRPFDDYFAQLYFDTLIHDEVELRHLIDVAGADHVLHGTDYPAAMGDWQQVPRIRDLPGLSDDEVAGILGGNALRLIAAG